jgi:glycerol-3-phosphate dehydrogenase (NAD(P)+)
MKISVIGAGAFGTALVNVIKNEHDIFLFSRNSQLVETINTSRRNTAFFPHKVLSKKIRCTADVKEVTSADLIFLCIPSHAIVSFIQSSKPASNAIIINGAKGFGERKKLIPQTLSEILPNEICSLKGPSFASELILEVPTSFTLATKNQLSFEKISSVFREEIVVFDHTEDVNGVEMLSILKNIYAIIIGIVDACYNSPNTRFLTFTKALNEINSILKLFNIPVETMFCYAGIGDFGLTALNDLSRNRTLGLLIGKGFFGNEISNTVVLEGVKAIDHLMDTIPTEMHGKLPLLFHVNQLIKSKITVREFVDCIIFQHKL